MKTITIYLGSRCNLHCPYCHREEGGELGVSDVLLDKIRGREDVRIKFMGGEPTLYMDEIQRVMKAAPGASYAIGTNGVGLEKHLDFFREHKFLVCISYDGTDLRGYDPFGGLIGYPWLAVSCTLYHGNTDFKSILKRFAEKERVIGQRLVFFPHIAHATGSHNEKFSLTSRDIGDVLKQYKECVGEFVGDYLRYGVINWRYYSMFRWLQDHYYAGFTFGETYCTHGRLKKMNTAGKMVTCLYIRDEVLDDGAWKEEQAGIIRSRFPQCETCEVYDMCGGACIKSIRHDLECAFYRPLYNWFRELYARDRDKLDRVVRG